MKKYSQSTVLTKLLTGFSVLIVMMLLLGGVAIYQLHSSNQHIEKYRENRLPGVRSSLEMRGVLSEMRLQQIQYINSTTPAEREKHRVELLQNQDIFLKAQHRYGQQLAGLPQDMRALFSQVVENFQHFVDVNAKVIETVNAEQLEEAAKISGAVSAKYRTQLMKDLATLVDMEIAIGDRAGESAEQGYSQALYMLCGLLLLALIATGFIAAYISRNLSRQLGGEPGYAVNIMEQIAAGKLDTAITLKADDEKSLLATIKFMNGRLAEIIHGIITGSESISHAASEIAMGNSDLSQRTEEQAASLVQTSANMQQITGNDSNLLIVFYVQIMPDDLVMQLHRF